MPNTHDSLPEGLPDHRNCCATKKDIAAASCWSITTEVLSNLKIIRSPKHGRDNLWEVITGKASLFVITAIAKLATCYRELLPRARVCIAKVAPSRNSLDMRVWRRARDYLGLMKEPATCLSVLGPVNGRGQKPGTVNWSEGGSKMAHHFPISPSHMCFLANDWTARPQEVDDYISSFSSYTRADVQIGNEIPHHVTEARLQYCSVLELCSV